MKRVLIETATGRLCDIVLPGAEFPVAPGLQWVDAPDDVAPATHLFNGVAVVVKPPKPLADVKEAKISSLRQSREAASVANVTVSGKVFTAEPETQTAFKRLADRLRRGKPTTLSAVLDVDGNPVAVSQALLDGIEDAIAANTEAAWNKYGQLAVQVKAAATVAEVEAIQWI